MKSEKSTIRNVRIEEDLEVAVLNVRIWILFVPSKLNNQGANIEIFRHVQNILCSCMRLEFLVKRVIVVS